MLTLSMPVWLPKLIVWCAAALLCGTLAITAWLDRRAAREAAEWLTEAQGGPRRGARA